jgi:hypothetical protein
MAFDYGLCSILEIGIIPASELISEGMPPAFHEIIIYQQY